MKGNNPLFVDSTKFAGDGIRTQFELSRLFLYEGERAIAKVVNLDGHSQIVPLHENQSLSFSGSIYLRHQEEISFQFIIKKEDKELFHSAEYKGRATYLISETWEPVIGWNTTVREVKPKPKVPSRILSEPLPEFEAQRKSLLSAVEALENFFSEPEPEAETKVSEPSIF